MDGQKDIKNPEIKINKVPFRCPVCNGFGSLKYGAKQCQACNGKGYVEVAQDGQKDYENPNR
jgi:DnaJ-class molecular chaperone